MHKEEVQEDEDKHEVVLDIYLILVIDFIGYWKLNEKTLSASISHTPACVPLQVGDYGVDGEQEHEHD